jgi:hypothetical protein
MTPLAYLALGLQKIEPPPPLSALEVATSEDEIEEEFDVPRFLIEKVVSADGYVWKFHKTDVDPWPSALHGHDYENGLKIDALTGEIFDVASRQRCKKLNRKALSRLQRELRKNKDLKVRAEACLP